ncbi:hypothetical protein ACNQ2K_01490 [Mycoplasma sp. VS292A]|uniref:hypothetical protein n=1 Tax=Mycoplasma sp. VS292A TaxID=3401680 RepID=UPI003AAEF932
MIHTKLKTKDNIFKYATTVKIILWLLYASPVALLIELIIWLILFLTQMFKDNYYLYVLYAILIIFAALILVFIISFLITGAIARKKVDTEELIQIIIFTKNSKCTILYRRLLMAMYPFSHYKKIASALNIEFVEVENNEQ